MRFSRSPARNVDAVCELSVRDNQRRCVAPAAKTVAERSTASASDYGLLRRMESDTGAHHLHGCRLLPLAQ